MASGSQNMTTFQAKHLIGDSTNVGWAGALLHSGTDGKDNTMDTWIFADDYGTAAAPWGIKHDQTNNRIVFVGANTEGAWITLNTGDTYILGKVGIGYDPSTSGNTYKLYVNGSSYFTDVALLTQGIRTGSRASTGSGSGVEIGTDGGIEIFHTSTPFIDFHYQASTADYSVRLLCNSATNLNCSGSFTTGGGITATGTIHANGGYLKSTLNSNTITIGSQNASWCHIENSANIPFWFNRSIGMAQGTTIGAAGNQYRPFQIYLGRNSTAGSNAINASNPLIEFSNSDRSQYCQLIYSDHDTIVAPDSLTLIGNQAGTHFIAPKINAGGYINNSYSMSTASFICQSWVRTTGSTGWYNESHGGGWYMTDDTWIRSYNNKSVYVNTGDLRCDGSTWGGNVRLVDNWLGVYATKGNASSTRYGYLQITSTKYYFRKENGADTWPFDFNGNIYTSGRIRLNSTEDVGLNQNGAFIIGNPASTNLAMDDNEIMARSNSAASTLYLNSEGGQVVGYQLWASSGPNGERQVGVSSGTSGNLYLYANTTRKGLYSGSGYYTGYIIRVESGNLYFGNASYFARLDGNIWKITSSEAVGFFKADYNAQAIKTGGLVSSYTYNDNAGPGILVLDRNTSDTGEVSIYFYTNQSVRAGFTFMANRVAWSSRAVKKNIFPLPSFGDALDKLQPVSFCYKQDKDTDINYGLIYEDTINILPYICFNTPGERIEKGICYEKLIPIFLKEIQDLRKRVKTLESQVKHLTNLKY